MNEYKETLQYYLDQIRSRLRDYADLNELLEDEETPDKLIAKFIIQAVDWFNGTPPELSMYYGWVNFPNRTLLIDMVMVLILESIALLDLRNLTPVQDGAGVASPHQKGQALWSIAQQMRSRVMQEITLKKRSLTIIESPITQGDYDTEMQYLFSFMGLGVIDANLR